MVSWNESILNFSDVGKLCWKVLLEMKMQEILIKVISESFIDRFQSFISRCFCFILSMLTTCTHLRNFINCESNL